jgi:hypothetical protein
LSIGGRSALRESPGEHGLRRRNVADFSESSSWEG